MLFLFLLLIVIVILGIIVYYSRQIVYPKVHSHKTINDYELENDRYSELLFKELKEKDITINSYLGYSLKGKIYLQDNPNKFVLMCHGITSNYDGMKKYCQIFIDNGYSIMLYDHRNHGYSDRNYTTLGYFEKKDAKCCIDYLMKKYDEPSVGVFGESMGAATALQLATIDDRLAFCIEDCGFSNAFTLMKYRSLKDHNKLVSMFTKPSDIYLKLFYKFSLVDVSVVHNLNMAKCPIMFIHGDEDDYVPYYMCQELYDVYKGPKDMYTVKGAKHALAQPTDPITYHERVSNFIKRYEKKQG